MYRLAFCYLVFLLPLCVCDVKAASQKLGKTIEKRDYNLRSSWLGAKYRPGDSVIAKELIGTYSRNSLSRKPADIDTIELKKSSMFFNHCAVVTTATSACMGHQLESKSEGTWSFGKGTISLRRKKFLVKHHSAKRYSLKQEVAERGETHLFLKRKNSDEWERLHPKGPADPNDPLRSLPFHASLLVVLWDECIYLVTLADMPFFIESIEQRPAERSKRLAHFFKKARTHSKGRTRGLPALPQEWKEKLNKALTDGVFTDDKYHDAIVFGRKLYTRKKP